MDNKISPEYYQYYDMLYQDRAIDFVMWEKFAKEANGHILDVGCGTGRLLHFLADQGFSITGIDISLDAVQQALAKGKSKKVSIFNADMRNFDLQRKSFGLAFMVHNTLLYCLSMEDQLGCLQSIHKHLSPDGRLIIDIFMPSYNSTDLGAQGKFHFGKEFIDDEGYIVQWFFSYSASFNDQKMDCTQILDKIDRAGIVHRSTIRFQQRFVYRCEMELLLKVAGFGLETIYGDYKFSSLHDQSERMIFVAKKTDKSIL